MSFFFFRWPITNDVQLPMQHHQLSPSSAMWLRYVILPFALVTHQWSYLLILSLAARLCKQSLSNCYCKRNFKIENEKCTDLRHQYCEYVYLFRLVAMFVCLQVYNKIDQISIEEVDRIAHEPNSVVVRYALVKSHFYCRHFLIMVTSYNGIDKSSWFLHCWYERSTAVIAATDWAKTAKSNKSKWRQREFIPSRFEKCSLGIIT